MFQCTPDIKYSMLYAIVLSNISWQIYKLSLNKTSLICRNNIQRIFRRF